MKVKSVCKEKDSPPFDGLGCAGRLAVRFEHAGVEWEKFFPLDADEITYKRWFQSVIDDTLARNTKWD